VIVIDASVAVKWFLPEVGSDAASALLTADDVELVGPDLLAVEVCATLVRGANMVKANRADALTKLAKFKAMLDMGAVNLIRTSPGLMHQAASRAIDIGHPLKDCLYLAMAMELGCDLVTCDARFMAKAREVWDRVRVLGEVR
jgi:predicted nucleic acid-binding protein